MENYKNFSLGGLFQAGRKMAPPWGSFRRLMNTFKDTDNTFKPYGRGAPVSNEPTKPAGSGAAGNTVGPVSTQKFNGGLLQFHMLRSALFGTHRGLFSYLGPDGTDMPIMQPFNSTAIHNAISLENHWEKQPSGNYSSCVVARKAYISSLINESEFNTDKVIGTFSPMDKSSWLMAFDGIRLRGAGLPTPWSPVDPSGVAAAHYVRTVYATLGLDGELILSPYLQQQLSSATRDVYTSGYSAYPGTRRADPIGATTTPAYRRPEDHLFEELKTSAGFDISGSNSRYFDKRFIKSSGVATITDGELSIVRNAYSACVDEGDWLMVDIGSPIGTVPATLYMFKVKTLAATTVFDKNIRYLDRNSVTWVDADFNTIVGTWDAIDISIKTAFLTVIGNIVFSNLFQIISYSTTAASGYRVAGIYPVAWESAQVYAGQVLSTPMSFSTPWAGVVSSFMADWYDVNFVMTTFPPVKGITSYKDLLLGFDDNAIYFSNINFGGSTEMVHGLSNIVPNGSEFGKITAVCGSESFLFISRERKNYILTGDIAGSSFNIDECDSPVIGAHNQRCVSNAWAGKVVFMNKTGIYSINSSGSVEDKSDEIKGLFKSNRDGNLFDKSVFRSLAQNRADGRDGSIFKIILEEERGFVIFLTAKIDGNFTVSGSNMLVLNTRENKWYEFEGVDALSVEAIDGKLVTFGMTRAEEDGVMRGTEKQLLVTQEITVDTPSLEKKTCQVKLYGEITPKTSDGKRGLTVGQINDFKVFDTDDRSEWNTNTTYSPKATEIYDHKKRLDSSMNVSTSIILESLETGSFQLEGMEIEGTVVQRTMK